MAENNQLGIQILNIKEVSFNNNSFELPSEFQQDRVEMKLGFSVDCQADKDLVSLIFEVSFRYSDSPKPKSFINFSTQTTFKFFNHKDSDQIKIEKDSVFVEDELMTFLLNISIGATRGMLSYRVANLPVNLVLPIIDVSSLLPKNNQVKKRASKRKSLDNKK